MEYETRFDTRGIQNLFGKSGVWDVVGSRTGGVGGLTQPWSKVSLPFEQLPTPPSSSQAPLVSTQREGRPCSLIRSYIQEEESDK